MSPSGRPAGSVWRSCCRSCGPAVLAVLLAVGLAVLLAARCWVRPERSDRVVVVSVAGVGGGLGARPGGTSERPACAHASPSRTAARCALGGSAASLAGSGARSGLGPALRLGRRLGTRGAADLARVDRGDEVVLAHLRRAGDAEARSKALELDDVHRRQAGAAGGGRPFGGVLSRRSFPLVVGAALVGGTGVGRRVRPSGVIEDHAAGQTNAAGPCGSGGCRSPSRGMSPLPGHQRGGLPCVAASQ